ncbi:MAG: ribosome silencing factor [Eubacteriales bacterium]|nr:ribosome silencing factor [Eubacteriales bacterium]
MDTLNLARFYADFLNKHNATKTEIIETKGSKLFDYLVVCTANDKIFAQTLLVDLLEYAKTELNQINCGLEGYKKAEWIVVDYGKVAVHIFSQKARDKFNMEKLWR